MKNLFVLVLVMTMTLATGCASLRKSSHTTQVHTVDSMASIKANAIYETTVANTIDTTVIVPADTLEYTWPYDVWELDSASTYPCAAVQDGTMVPAVKKVKELVINTPAAKAKFTAHNGQWHAQIIVPQKSKPIKQTNYTHTAVHTSKTATASVQTETTNKQSNKEVKSGWRIYVLGIGTVILLWLLIQFLIKKYL
jgi:uncharacterized protein YceK